jgi:glycosyltransferase involved in cell wall biosynthesis
MRPLRVCIDARLSGGHGGVEQVIIGLAGALSRLDDTTEEYLFLVHPGDGDWLRHHLTGACRLLELGKPPRRRGLASRIAWQLQARLPWLPRRNWPPPTDGYTPEQLEVLGVSDGTIEAAGVDVIHFGLTLGFLTQVPSIYQPHDLQHVHLPDFFGPDEIARRDLTYRVFSERAELAVMMTSWGKEDLVRRYDLDPQRVAVVPGGSVLSNYPVPSDADLAEVRRNLDLPDQFILFPAQTWRHKNHLALIEALAVLRDRHGLEVTAICPGKHTDHLAEIEARAAELGLSRAIRFPGFVTPLELRSLYTLATAMVFPSLFEGWGLPVSEAMSVGLPVACSDIPSLRDVAGDAALTFDPGSPEQIADRVVQLWGDEGLRRSLAERGKRRSDEFSFDHTALLFRAHYRQIGGRPLSEQDRELLDAPPLA